MGKDLSGKDIGKGYRQNRKDGRYEFRYVNCHGVRTSIYDSSLTELRKKATKAVADSLSGKAIKDSSITLDTWFESWLELEKYEVTRDVTRKGYRRVYEKHISSVLGSKRLKEISILDIQRLLRELKKSNYGYATRNRVHILFDDMLDKALKHDLVLKNVAKNIKVKRDEEKEPRFLTDSELVEFLDAAKGTFYYNMFVFAVESGLRPGEVYGLKFDDIDFENNLIHVKRTLHYDEPEGKNDGKQFFFGPPKTATSIRKVPLSNRCKEVLQKQIKQSIAVKERLSAKNVDKEFEDLIFTTKFATPICAEIGIDAIKRVVNELNLTKSNLEQFEMFNMHSLRHTFATQCMQKGIKLKTLSVWLGHASVKMTEDLYVHLSEQFSQEEIELLNTDRVSKEDNIVTLPDRGIKGVQLTEKGVQEMLQAMLHQALSEVVSL